MKNRAFGRGSEAPLTGRDGRPARPFIPGDPSKKLSASPQLAGRAYPLLAVSTLAGGVNSMET